MPIPIGRLPPLASHFFCLILGVVFTNLASPENTDTECYLPGKVQIAFPDKIWQADRKMQVFPGHKVYFVKQQQNQKFCLMKKSKGMLLQAEPFVVMAISFRDLKELAEVFNKKYQGRLSLIDDAELLDYPQCSQTEVHFG